MTIKRFQFTIALVVLLCSNSFSFSQDLIVRSTGDSTFSHTTKVTDSIASYESNKNGLTSSSLAHSETKQISKEYYNTIEQKIDSAWTKDRNLSLELFGSCLFGSVHFENRIGSHRNLRYDVGLSFWSYNTESTLMGTNLFLASGLHYLMGKHRSKFESGVGGVVYLRYFGPDKNYFKEGEYILSTMGNIYLGYRYEASRHIFKVGITIFSRFFKREIVRGQTNISTDLFIMPWPSIGYGFKI